MRNEVKVAIRKQGMDESPLQSFWRRSLPGWPKKDKKRQIFFPQLLSILGPPEAIIGTVPTDRPPIYGNASKVFHSFFFSPEDAGGGAFMVRALDGGFVCMLGNYFRSRLGKSVFEKGGRGMHPRILWGRKGGGKPQLASVAEKRRRRRK